MRALGLLAVLLVLPVAGCDGTSDCTTETCTTTDTFGTEDVTPDGTTLGATLEINDCFSVDYVGRLADGSGTFDEGSLSRFYNGAAGLIPGFLLGLGDQRVGQTRRITIPPGLGYGACPLTGRGDPYVGIPACSTIEFDVTLTAIHQDNRVCTGGL